jgi:chromosome segregation ATPase
MRRLLDSHNSLDKLYRDASGSLTTLERRHRFTMSELERHRDELKVSQNEVSRLNRLLSSRDSIIRELCASKKLVSQELEIARRDIKVLEDDCHTRF